MALSFDLFWSFRSPYSYLATRRLRALAGDNGIACNVRIVYPLAVRNPDFFRNSDRRRITYTLLDARRVADMLDIPFQWPDPDPIVQNMETLEIADDQPYIFRLSRLGVIAAEYGKGLAFIDEVSRLIWSGTANWHTGDHLHGAAQRAGLDLATMDSQAEAQAARLDRMIAENQDAQAAAGHWGVPLMVFDGEPFFGQDRIDALIWRMRQKQP